MNKINLLIFLGAFALASVVLLISLQSANRQITPGSPQMRGQKLYMTAEILPDHSFYPVLMAYDFLRLQLADQYSRGDLLLSYSKRRDYYAQRLLDKGKVDLAATTFAKAVKYLNQALVDPEADSQKQALLRSHREQARWWLEIRDRLNEQDKILLEDLFAARENLIK
jgi:hypothetical protein